MAFSRQQIDDALDHLRAHDPVMRALIRRVGPFRLRPERDRFWMLVRSILSQQISTKAARSIRLRVEAIVAPEIPSAENLIRVEDDRLRSAGVSPQKLRYLRDLCEHVLDDRLQLRQIGRLSDERVVDSLIRIKGIGRWTAQMFLMFALGRLDVFPHDDHGIRTALRNLYDLDNLPDKVTSLQIAEPWRPYATVACWYCWRSTDLDQTQPADATRYPV